MKKQIFIVGGGEAFENVLSQKYIEARLKHIKKDYDYSPYDEKKKWKQTLGIQLGKNYEILNMLTPKASSANYEEWKIMFEKAFPYFKEDIILIGHSLGGTFLVKYLNENILPVKVSQILLVAPAFEDSKQEILGSFNFDKDLKTFKKYCDKIIMYYSLDDGVVLISDFENFKRVLGNIECKEFNNKGHFSQEDFPEIIEDIKNIK